MRAGGSGRRQLWLDIMLPVVVLCIAELGVRAYVAFSPVPLAPRLFPFPVTTAKYLAYRVLAEQDRPVDVLLMGLSPMMRVSAKGLSTMVRERSGQEITAFNFAAPLQTLDYNRRLLADVLLKINKPRVLVYGIMPINLLNNENPAQTEIYIGASPVFSAHGDTVSASLYRFALDHIALFRYRDVIRDRLLVGPHVEGLAHLAETTDAYGDIPLHAPYHRVVRQLTNYELEYRSGFRNFDALLRDSLLFPHIEALARLCHEHGIQLVLLNDPVHALFFRLLPHRGNDYRAFMARLKAVAAAANVLYFDPTGGLTGAREFFQDTHHYNNDGARWVTEALATFLLQHGLLDDTQGRTEPAGGALLSGPASTPR